MVNDTTVKNKAQAGHTPLDKGKKDIQTLLKENEHIVTAQSLMSSVTLNYSQDEYALPSQNKFFQTFDNRVYLCKKVKKDKLGVKLVTTFIIIEVKECKLIFNDKSGKKPMKYYLVTLKNVTGHIEKDVELANNSKSDYKLCQTQLNEISNGYTINMTEQEYKAFVETYILPKVVKRVTIYINAGVLSDNEILYENALVRENKIIWADKDGYIRLDENSSIMLKKSDHFLPKLHKCDKTGKQVAQELMENIKYTWGDNIVPALLTLGHMIMSVFFEHFIKRYGVPTLILFGDSGSGKSTLIVTGLAIFGLSKDGLTSGGSTAKSNEFFISHYNGLPVAIDDIKGDTLKSQSFIALIKGAYKGIPRTRMLPYGRGIDYIQICSPLVYSTNESLPELKELVNRLNIIEIFGNKFKANEYKYHEFSKDNSENLKELSLVLPELLKFDKTTVFSMYEDVFKTLQANVKDTQKRIVNNISYAYTGALLLSIISDVEFEDLEQKVVEFAKKQIQQYDNIKTPVEKVLSAIITLTDLHYLEPEKHFRIFDVEYEGRMESHIRFNKDLIISAINKYYSHDKTMRIDSDSFLRYAKNHKSFRKNNCPVRYSDDMSKVVSSISFDVSGIEEFAHLSVNGICAKDNEYTTSFKPMTASQLRDIVSKQGDNAM